MKCCRCHCKVTTKSDSCWGVSCPVFLWNNIFLTCGLEDGCVLCFLKQSISGCFFFLGRWNVGHQQWRRLRKRNPTGCLVMQSTPLVCLIQEFQARDPYQPLSLSLVLWLTSLSLSRWQWFTWLTEPAHQWDVSLSLGFVCQNKPLTSINVHEVIKFCVLKSELAANVIIDT